MKIIPIPFKTICSITNGTCHNEKFIKKNNLTFHFISIDSRKIILGCLFIALIGKQFDAHDFIQEAVKKGASAILLEKKSDINIPQIIVKNTIIALGKIAKWIRKKSNAHIIAITGSSGKTSVKEITTSIVQCYGKTLSTFKNFNNNIGVPLTLLNLNKSHRYVIIEIGANQPNEILYSTNIVKPNIVLINNIHLSHLEGFKSLSGVSKVKQEIISNLPKHGTIIFNKDSHNWKTWKKNTKNHNIIWFSIKKKPKYSQITLF
ncbi:MAG: Mur ligase family protein [Buchnera aphidicola (Nurudea yanoniella)]